MALDESQLRTMLLLDLELRLQSFEKELTDFGLPKPTQEELDKVHTITNIDPVVIREEKDFVKDGRKGHFNKDASKNIEGKCRKSDK